MVANYDSASRNYLGGGGRVRSKVTVWQTLCMLSLALAHQNLEVAQVQAVASPTEQGNRDVSNGDLKIVEDDSIERVSSHNPLLADEEDIAQFEDTTEQDIIVVVAVDGTIAGISKDSGELLWKQQPSVESGRTFRSDATSASSTSTPGRPNMLHPGKRGTSLQDRELPASASQAILRPLLSTSTTRQTAASSEYAAVPSLDGNVYLTSHHGVTAESENDDGCPDQNDPLTISTSVRELVQRAPFLDPHGRFYVGSRQDSVAAIDKLTGEIVSVISATDAKGQVTSSPFLEGRSVIWMGRVDYSITVQDARTGIQDVQFSVAEFFSVADLQASSAARTTGTKKRESALKSTRLPGSSDDDLDDNDNLDPDGESEEWVQAATADVTPSSSLWASSSEISTTTSLIATPSGNVALMQEASGQLSWVAQEQFETPIAFAIDVSTGQTIGVDLIPDVTKPSSNDLEYLSKEMERQLDLIASNTDSDQEDEEQTIVGRLQESGQLYALPLGRRGLPQQSIRKASLHPSVSQHGASFAATAATKQKPVPHLAGGVGRSTTHLTQGGHHHSLESLPSTRKPCHPASPHFPSCLVDHHKHQPARLEHFAKNKDNAFSSEGLPPYYGEADKSKNNELAVVASSNKPHSRHSQHQQQKQSEARVYHPEYGYIDPNTFSQNARPKSNYYKFLKILGSWLPPTIAMIFVLSFELGRRKRLQDETTSSKEPGSEQEEVSTVPAPGFGGDGAHTNRLAELQAGLREPQHVQQHVIQVSDLVLGYGGQGTVVYKGVLDGRDVAVKRMLKAYHASADREIRLLIESDGHPNVVRYFLKEIRGDFVYLALELCDLSLHDLIGVLRATDSSTLTSTEEIPIPISSTKVVLKQIAAGVKHLHSLRIVHRDLKPANILLAIPKRGKKKAVREGTTVYENFVKGAYVAKISDMGLGKQIVGQSTLGASMMATPSFQGTKGGASSVGVGPGSVGWQAPEVMALRWTASDSSARSGESNGCNFEASPADLVSTSARLSRSADIFSLGCIFYSTLVPGHHPFGEWYEREANIMHNRPTIDALEAISPEAYYLVRSMLERNPKLRPTAKQICEHPFFWISQKKLSFLCEFSDRLETDTTVPTSIQLIKTLTIERGAVEVVGTSWDQKLDDPLISNMQRFRTYDPSSVRDLLRLIRNKHHHFDELPEEFRTTKVANQDVLLEYFEQRFPRLLMHCWKCCRSVLTGNDPLLTKYDILPVPKPEIRRTLSSAPESVIVKAVNGDKQGASGIPVSEENIPTADQGRNSSSKVEEKDEFLGFEMVTSELEGQEVKQYRKAFHENFDEVSEPSLVSLSVPMDLPDDVIAWEGSTAAKELNCRGWSRYEEEWARRIDPCFRKRDPNLKRATEDHKFRTRLCNHWDVSLGTFCPMRKKNKCVFAHGPVELRVKEGKKNRWGKLVDKNGDNKNPRHSGGEDTYGAARSIETVRKEEGKWNTGKGQSKGRKNTSSANRTKKPSGGPPQQVQSSTTTNTVQA